MFGLQKQNHEHVQVFCPFWWKLPEKIRLQNKKNTNEFLYLIFVQHFCAKIRVNLHKSSVSSPSIASFPFLGSITYVEIHWSFHQPVERSIFSSLSEAAVSRGRSEVRGSKSKQEATMIFFCNSSSSEVHAVVTLTPV